MVASPVAATRPCRADDLPITPRHPSLWRRYGFTCSDHAGVRSFVVVRHRAAGGSRAPLIAGAGHGFADWIIAMATSRVQQTPTSDTTSSPTRRGRIGLIVAASLATGLVAALLLPFVMTRSSGWPPLSVRVRSASV